MTTRWCVWLAVIVAPACAHVAGAGSTVAAESDALYDAAVASASPGSPLHDPDRAAELLSTFVGRFPGDPRRSDAARLLALVNEVRSLRAELRALKTIDLDRPPRDD